MHTLLAFGRLAVSQKKSARALVLRTRALQGFGSCLPAVTAARCTSSSGMVSSTLFERSSDTVDSSTNLMVAPELRPPASWTDKRNTPMSASGESPPVRADLLGRTREETDRPPWPEGEGLLRQARGECSKIQERKKAAALS